MALVVAGRGGTPAGSRPKGPRLTTVGGIGVSAALITGAGVLLWRRYLRWGSTGVDQRSTLVGDGLLPAADQSTTRAITIDTQAADVWPWLAQLGQGRGGFYSYDRLEQLVIRLDFHNADRIVPEWQQIAVGDEVRLAPEIALEVVVVDPNRALVLTGSAAAGTVAPPYEFTWAFVLLPQPDGTTRLVVRERYQYTRRWAALTVQPAQLASCLMTRKMLLGIKMRAENASMCASAPTTSRLCPAVHATQPRERRLQRHAWRRRASLRVRG